MQKRSSRCADTPLCVDLDGTLIRTDSLIEGILSILSQRRGIGKLPQLSAATRAIFKQRVGALADLRPELLPYNAELLEFLHGQKREGRRIVLVTAADQSTAQSIANHLDLFDEIIASNGDRNLKGAAKANELVLRFGRKGFDYAGDSRADLAVWREANGIIIVNASQAVAREARALGKVIAEFNCRRSPILAMIRAMRPHQWVKNLLVFVPILASRSFTDWPAVLGALGMFVSFCAAASGIYLLNDLMDLTADRRHPTKRNRPFASGALSLPFGALFAITLVATGLVLAHSVGASSLLLAYAAISFAYSLVLKQYPLLDVFILSALYTLRIVAGGVASEHRVTLWLLAFSGFLFLGLALVKRTREIAANDFNQSTVRRGYFPEDHAILQTFGVASAFAACVVLALFVNSTTAVETYAAPDLLWGLVPLILFWQLRLWLSTQRGHMHDDPIVYASRDWVSWWVAIGVIVVVLAASWGPVIW